MNKNLTDLCNKAREDKYEKEAIEKDEAESRNQEYIRKTKLKQLEEDATRKTELDEKKRKLQKITDLDLPLKLFSEAVRLICDDVKVHENLAKYIVHNDNDKWIVLIYDHFMAGLFVTGIDTHSFNEIYDNDYMMKTETIKRMARRKFSQTIERGPFKDYKLQATYHFWSNNYLVLYKPTMSTALWLP